MVKFVELVEKANPYHDKRGRFATKGGGGGGGGGGKGDPNDLVASPRGKHIPMKRSQYLARRKAGQKGYESEPKVMRAASKMKATAVKPAKKSGKKTAKRTAKKARRAAPLYD